MRNALLGAGLALLVALPACSPQPAPETPRPVVTVTARPTAPPDPSNPSAPRTEVFRVRAEFLELTDLTFEVMLNGQKVGTFAADARNEITPLVQPGGNQISVGWKQEGPIPKTSKAQLFLESQRPGQEDWNTLFSCEVDSKTTRHSAAGTFEVIPAP